MSSTYCNPLDLPHRISELSVGPFYRRAFREAADPSMVLFNGRYFLFPSMSGGFWHSNNLLDWDFVATPTLPTYDYAPDVREIDGKLVVCASRSTGVCSFYRSADPLGGRWEEIPGTFPFFDPSLFQDDDGRVYLYWGCSNKTPLQVQELDRRTFERIGEPQTLFGSNTAEHGWERVGADWNPENDNNIGFITSKFAGPEPYVEGAWMTKHDGIYYLQYASPGTQLNTYSDGYYTSESPLGPFTYAPSSPFSSKPGGFMNGAGHGSTTRDRHGNWWHISTMAISVNHMFERRLGLWPAGFDEDGVLYCNQEFGDYPLTMPDGLVDPWSLTPKDMLLSYGRPVTASAEDARHPARLVVDEDAKSWWVAPRRASGQWVMVELPADATVSSIQVNLAEHELRAPRRKRAEVTRTLLWNRHVDLSEAPAEVLLEASVDGVSWESLLDNRGVGGGRTHLFVKLDTPRPFRFVRLTGFQQPHGSRFAVSGLRVFGIGAGSAPSEAVPTAHRVSDLNALIQWAPVDGANGYNVRYGLSPDKLYHSWLLHGQHDLELGSLNAGHEYWIAVDAFNENGVTRGRVVRLAATAEQGGE